MKQIWHRNWKRLTLALVIIFAFVNWDSIIALVCFGYWPQSRVETLRSPIEVTGWSRAGLQLASGTVLQLPGFRKLPERSEALDKATRRGIEIDQNGRVIGLIKIWHWCGNDALWNDVRRVDVAHLLEFMREGEFDRLIAESDPKPYKPGGAFRPSGWNVSERVLYEHFLRGDWQFPLLNKPSKS